MQHTTHNTTAKHTYRRSRRSALVSHIAHPPLWVQRKEHPPVIHTFAVYFYPFTSSFPPTDVLPASSPRFSCNWPPRTPAGGRCDSPLEMTLLTRLPHPTPLTLVTAFISARVSLCKYIVKVFSIIFFCLVFFLVYRVCFSLLCVCGQKRLQSQMLHKPESRLTRYDAVPTETRSSSSTADFGQFESKKTPAA